MKRYYILLAIVAGLLFSCKDDTNPPKMEISEIVKTDVEVSYHEATITDTFQLMNDNIEVELFYSADSSVVNPESIREIVKITPIVTKIDGCYVVTSSLKNLNDNTEYYFVYGFSSQFDAHKTGKISRYSKIRSFKTLENLPPLVETNGCAEYGFYYADVIVEKKSDNSDSQTTSWGVCYATHEQPTIEDYRVLCMSNENQTYKASLNNLESGTTYYYRAFGTNKYGTSYGEEMSLTTVSESVMDVETQSPTLIGKNYAILAGRITSHANLKITEKGFYVSKSNSEPGENDRKIVCVVSGEGAYQSQADGLNTSTTYYVRAYAICQYCELKGNVVSFTTEQ